MNVKKSNKFIYLISRLIQLSYQNTNYNNDPINSQVDSGNMFALVLVKNGHHDSEDDHEDDPDVRYDAERAR